MYKTYQDYCKARQDRVNALPLYWAFSDQQFEEVLKKTGASGPEDFYKGPGGSFYLKTDAPIIHAYLDEEDPLPELLKDYDWAKGAFIYEMGNHEYHINWQADYDVVNCFANVDYEEGEEKGYLSLTGWEEQTKRAYIDARNEFYKKCDENDWW